MLPSLIKDKKKQCCHINGDSEKYHIIAEIMTLKSLLFRIKDYIYRTTIYCTTKKSDSQSKKVVCAFSEVLIKLYVFNSC